MKKLIILLFPFLLTGCWNYRELNDIAIVSAISIEKNNDEYDLSVQIMNTKKGSSEGGSSTTSNSSPITILSTKGKTIHEALRDIVLQSPKKLYIGHMDVIVIDEKVAFNGLNDIIDFFMRDPESRKQFKVIVTRDDSASDLIKIVTPLETLPSHDLLATIQAADTNKGSIREITYDELLSSIYAEGIEGVIPVVKIVGPIEEGGSTKNTESSQPKTNLILDSLAILNGDRLVGHLSPEEGLGYAFVSNNIKYSVISFKCDDINYAAVEIVKNKSDFKVSIKDGKPFVDIIVDSKAYLSEINCRIDITRQENNEKLAKMAEEKIKSLMTASIEKVKKQYGSDIFGFGKYLYRNNSTYWKENHYNWTSIFSNIDYNIKVNLVIDKKGSILESAKEG